jgi:hypothetical protein
MMLQRARSLETNAESRCLQNFEERAKVLRVEGAGNVQPPSTHLELESPDRAMARYLDECWSALRDRCSHRHLPRRHLPSVFDSRLSFHAQFVSVFGL